MSSEESKRTLKERVTEYGEILKIFIESLTGKKDIKTKVQVLTSPENPKSMSVLSEPQARFVALSHYVAGVESWGGLFDGLKDYSNEMMDVSPSKGGLGREQVIRFAGALTESALAKSLKLGLGEKGEEGETKE